jgi:hypothetical protein
MQWSLGLPGKLPRRFPFLQASQQRAPWTARLEASLQSREQPTIVIFQHQFFEHTRQSHRFF